MVRDLEKAYLAIIKQKWSKPNGEKMKRKELSSNQ